MVGVARGVWLKPISVQVSKQFILLYLGLVPELIVFFSLYFFLLGVRA